jgi:uracil-DNA glycosylase
VAPMGAVALAALDRLCPHGLTLKAGAGRPHPWNGRVLFPLVHPSPRARVHRPEAAQRADWEALAQVLAAARAGAQAGIRFRARAASTRSRPLRLA